MKPKALIIGIAGQDGAYLAALLLKNGYSVFGVCRAGVASNLWRLHELQIENAVQLIPLELKNIAEICKLMEELRPDEVYNLAAQSFVTDSFNSALTVMETDGLNASRILGALQKGSPQTRFFQASTAELFGNSIVEFQNEETPFHPRNPYGVAKLAAHWATVNAREFFRIFACNGILFNHESSLRGPAFVTRKITKGLACIKSGEGAPIALGNLDARRDWGAASDYVKGMWLMLRHDEASDYILATGISHTVREFIEEAAGFCDFSIGWEGAGLNEIGRDTKTGKIIVRIDEAFYRPVEGRLVCGDASKAAKVLGWKPKLDFSGLVAEMMSADLRRLA